MIEFDTLAACAYRAERVASRRLAARLAISEHEALARTLALAAGAASLEQLCAARHAEREAGIARVAARRQGQRDARAQRQAVLAPPGGAWLAWFDGSAHPNPGRMGIGATLTCPAGERRDISRHAGHGSSSEAEYLALIAVLELAVPLQPALLAIHGDSQVVINDVTQAGAGARGLHALRERARELIAQLPGVSLRWIPRHRNGAADALSQRAAAPATSEA